MLGSTQDVVAWIADRGLAPGPGPETETEDMVDSIIGGIVPAPGLVTEADSTRLDGMGIGDSAIVIVARAMQYSTLKVYAQLYHGAGQPYDPMHS